MKMIVIGKSLFLILCISIFGCENQTNRKDDTSNFNKNEQQFSQDSIKFYPKLVNERYVLIQFVSDSISKKEFKNEDTLISRINVSNDFIFKYNLSADSIFNLVKNENCEVIFYRQGSLFENRCYIRIKVKEGYIHLFDLSKTYFKEKIILKFNQIEFDWVYNCLCYMKSGKDCFNLSQYSESEWRKNRKKIDFESWKKLNWNKIEK